MKLLITGSRQITNPFVVDRAIDNFLQAYGGIYSVSEIISGRSCPVDFLAERWAREHNIPCVQVTKDPCVPAEALGYVRNVEASRIADAFLIIRTPYSTEFDNLIHIAQTMLRPVHIYNAE